MKRYFEVIINILPLLETMEEALSYAKDKFVQLQFEEGFTVLEDILTGIFSVKNAMIPFENELPENKIDVLFSSLKQDFDILIENLQQSEGMNLVDQINDVIITNFEKWKSEIRKTIRPYNAS